LRNVNSIKAKLRQKNKDDSFNKLTEEEQEDINKQIQDCKQAKLIASQNFKNPKEGLLKFSKEFQEYSGMDDRYFEDIDFYWDTLREKIIHEKKLQWLAIGNKEVLNSNNIVI
jgi:hypothetical protein